MQQTTVAYRLGWFLYWVCLLALIALYWVFWINTMGETMVARLEGVVGFNDSRIHALRT